MNTGLNSYRNRGSQNAYQPYGGWGAEDYGDGYGGLATGDGTYDTSTFDTFDYNQPLAQSDYTKNFINDQQGGSGIWGTNMSGKDMFQAGFGAMNAGLGVLNYRENKKFNKARIKGLKENIAASQEQRQQRRDFLSGTQNAFGSR